MADISTYCDVQDVESHTGYQYEGSSQPSNVEAMGIVQDVSAEVDGVLKASGYLVPVPETAPRARRLVGHYTKLGAAYRCWHAMFKSSQAPPAVASWETDFRNFLTAIKENEIRLPDYEPISGRRDSFLRALG